VYRICLGFEENPKNCTSRMCPLYPFRGKTLLAYDNIQDEIETEEAKEVS
jgi:hypothetical protein